MEVEDELLGEIGNVARGFDQSFPAVVLESDEVVNGVHKVVSNTVSTAEGGHDNLSHVRQSLLDSHQRQPEWRRPETQETKAQPQHSSRRQREEVRLQLSCCSQMQICAGLIPVRSMQEEWSQSLQWPK